MNNLHSITLYKLHNKLSCVSSKSSQSSSTCRASRASRVRRVERVELCCLTSSTQPKCMGSTRRMCRVESSPIEPSGIWAYPRISAKQTEWLTVVFPANLVRWEFVFLVCFVFRIYTMYKMKSFCVIATVVIGAASGLLFGFWFWYWLSTNRKTPWLGYHADGESSRLLDTWYLMDNGLRRVLFKCPYLSNGGPGDSCRR